MKTRQIYFLIFSLFILISSCSKDDDNDNNPGFVVPTIPGVGIEENSVQLVFKASAEESTVTLGVESKTGDVFINWGDNESLDTYLSGEVTYTYPAEEKEYIISIMSSRISAINLLSEQSLHITGFFAGDCPELMSIQFNKINEFENFDVTKCSQFSQLQMYIHNDNFDLSGLSNATALGLFVCSNMDIHLKDYPNLSSLYISLERQYAKPKNIQVEKCPQLTDTRINSYNTYSSSPSNRICWVKNLILDIPLLKDLKLEDLTITEDLDLRKTGDNFETLILNSFNYQKGIYFNSSMRNFLINNMWKPRVDFEKKEIDLSQCKQLEAVQIDGLSSLEHIRLGNKETLGKYWLQLCPNVKEFEFSSYPALENLSCFNNVGVKSIKMKDLPELGYIAFSQNQNLTELDAENVSGIYNVELGNNQLDENMIKQFFSLLTDAPMPDGKNRRIMIYGNPGDTENMRSIIRNTDHWDLVGSYEPAFKSNTEMNDEKSDKFSSQSNSIHLKAN